MSFGKILIANRGEIACRVMRTARRLGYRTVAVYSDADARSPHVEQADEALRIGPAAAAQSYLNASALLHAAQHSGADAVHPGYGFLSERADFAQACLAAGLVFIGPPPAAIRAMGDKAQAKRRMRDAGVPCAGGYWGEDQSDARLLAEADRLGVPLLVKAVAGGGGRGMRLVRSRADLLEAIAGARREAISAFGDGTLMLEQLIEHGRHIEVQVFADSHGNIVHLGDRDCSAQRRRQKLIEEAPAPRLAPALREALARDAVAAARAVGYEGAGTVEFMVDAQQRHFFLEMNTRLQVEHTVTECITGIDLVEWQLRVAAGQALPLRQEKITFSGHAIQARLVAEDPYDGWKPHSGRIVGWRPARSQIRIDHGIAEGGEVTPHYDALVAKFVAHGHDRDDAARRLARALQDVPLLGPRSNGRFLRDLLRHPRFGASGISTTTLDDWALAGEPLLQRPSPPDAAWRIAAALLAGPLGQRPASVASFDIELCCQGERRTLRAPTERVQVLSWQDQVARVMIDGMQSQLIAVQDGQVLHLALDAAVFCFEEPSAWPAADSAADPGRARAAVAGVVAQVSVQAGERVAAGQPLVCVEAMKMEMWLVAGAAGTVRAVHVRTRDAVAAGAVLVELDLAP